MLDFIQGKDIVSSVFNPHEVLGHHVLILSNHLIVDPVYFQNSILVVVNVFNFSQ